MTRGTPVVLILGLALSARIGGAQEAAKTPRFRIEGTWDLNIAKSEEPGAQMHRGGPGGFGGRGGYPGGRGGGWGGRGGGRGRMPPEPPEEGPRAGTGGGGSGMTTAYRLVFAQSDTMLTITVPGNSIRRIRLDRRESADTTLDGRITKVKTKLDEKKLEVERESEMGKFSETYEIDRDTGELVIKTKVSGRRGSFTFKRVYVRAKDEG